MPAWNYERAHRAFCQGVPSDRVLWKNVCESGHPFDTLTEFKRQLPKERQHELNVIAPIISTWLRWEYEKQATTPVWHHWFLEPEMAGIFMGANSHALPVSKVQLPPGTGIRVFSHDHVGCYADIVLAFVRKESTGDDEPWLLLSSNVYDKNGKGRGAACLFPWPSDGTIGEAYEYAMSHLSTEDEGARIAIFEALVVGLSAWLFFTSMDPDSITLENPTYEREMRKVSRLTGMAKKKAKRELGKKPPGYQVFRLRDLPSPQRSISPEPLSSTETDRPETSSGTRSAHPVRAHWRWQACGLRWSQHKLILVKQHRRGQDDGTTIGYRFRGGDVKC